MKIGRSVSRNIIWQHDGGNYCFRDTIRHDSNSNIDFYLFRTVINATWSEIGISMDLILNSK